MSLKIRQKLSKLKWKGGKYENHNRISKNYGTITKDITGILEREKSEKGAKEIFEVIMVENFMKLMADTKP